MRKTSSKSSKLKEAISLCKNDTADMALNELLSLAEEGCNEALSYIGSIYELGGENVDRDYDKAKYYYEKSIQRFGSVAAYLGLVRIHFNSSGSNHDCHKTLRYCETIAESIGHPEAYYYMGRVYLEGCCLEKI